MSLPIALYPSQNIYKYILINKIGQGGFGEVWLAKDAAVDRDYAIKILDTNNVSIDERLQEAKTGNHLEHQNLIKIHNADVVTVADVNQNNHNLVIITMDFKEKGSCIKLLNSMGFIRTNAAIGLITDILRGLEYLHNQEFYHNDIKPENILLGNSDEGILTDYGITVKAPNQCKATPKSCYKLHKAPEVINSNLISSQTDIFQVGLTLFRLLNGNGILHEKRTAMGESDYNTAILKGSLIKDSDFLPLIPHKLITIVKKAINPDPEHRYKTPLEMRRVLEKISYPGFWTCNEHGHFIGDYGKNTYNFVIENTGSNLYNFTGMKTNKSSSRQTSVTKYTKKNMNTAELKQIQKEFMQSVLLGSIR